MQKKKEKDNGNPKARIINKDTDFSTVETYKAIRTNIMFSMPKTEGGKTIVVTSSIPGEGKTTTCINLALTFAQTGAKVALVDCDLRKARIHRYLELERDKGVSNILCGFIELKDAICKNVRENLDVLTAGEIPPNPAEILASDAFETLIKDLEKQYDYIFVDTPPMTVVTDAAVIMRHSMGVVVVVRSGLTTFDMLDVTIGNIKRVGTKILGSIVLGCIANESKYGYRKSGYYRSGRYGYKYSYKQHYGDENEDKND